MPEGDTIRRLAYRLNSRFANAAVERSVFRHPRLATHDLSGSCIEEVESYGKHLLLRFDSGITLHTHLRLRGGVVAGFPRRVPAWRRHFELKTDRGWIVGYNLTVLDLVRTSSEPRLLEHLGPDVCGPYRHDEGVRRLVADSHLCVGAALLDQRIVCGLGNIYAVEAPFCVGVSPLTKVGDLDRPDTLLAIAVALIRTNARLGPQNTTGRRRQESDHWVLNSRIRQCRVCGDVLTRLQDRETPWKRRTAICPTCQPADSGQVDRARAARLLSAHPCSRMIDFESGDFNSEADFSPVTPLITGRTKRR